MIIDTTLFNDEFDMLDIRIALTQDWVDQWIICEGNRTMSGKPKPYHLSKNIDRYKHLGNRFKVITLDIPQSWSNWDIENGQRAAILPGYQDADPNDIIMHSDLDEILNPELVPEILSHLDQHDCPISCGLEMYIYRFDQRLERGWQGNVVARKRHFKDPCTLYKGPDAGVGHAQKRKRRTGSVGFPKPAGWHWGWMGSDATVVNKIKSCIETQNRDVNEFMEHLHRLDPASAINQKCRTHLVQPDYPQCVMKVIKKYPWWS